MTEGKDGTFLKRMRAAVRGERSAATLEGMRRASQGVFEELALADRHRNELLTGDGSLWRPPPATATHLLATWNAYVLHTLGAKLLDSYYAAHPGTAGYVAPETFEQVWWWLGSVQGWLSRARQARSNPDYDIRRELRLPVDLPPWSEAKPVPAVDDRITVFKSVGMALEDLVAADLAYKKAVELGIGNPLR